MKDMLLAEIVTQFPEVAEIFENHRLDFCCRGNRTLALSCSDSGLDVDVVCGEIESLIGQSSAEECSPADLPLDQLVQHICTRHHSYVRKMLPLINRHLHAIVGAHGDRHSELSEIAALWDDLTIEMTLHMHKEETILFPYVGALCGAGPDVADSACFRSVRSPISVMEFEHERAGRTMEKIAVLSKGFTPPEDACTTYRLCLTELRDFERDLHTHVHLENNILFPKSIELENQLHQIQ